MTLRQTYTSCLLKILFNLLINERTSTRLKPGQMRFRLTGIYILHWILDSLAWLETENVCLTLHFLHVYFYLYKTKY